MVVDVWTGCFFVLGVLFKKINTYRLKKKEQSILYLKNKEIDKDIFLKVTADFINKITQGP